MKLTKPLQTPGARRAELTEVMPKLPGEQFPPLDQCQSSGWLPPLVSHKLDANLLPD
jgi:hypothetical protein